MTNNELIEAAERAREKAYCPYSGFAVGAALLCEDGKVYTGCNIENSAFSPTACAERVAFFSAVRDGERKFKSIAIVGGKADEAPRELCPPCGVCRQVMSEFCGEDFEIILGTHENIRVFTLKDILPLGFELE